MDDVVAVRSARRGSLPQLVVEIRWHRYHFALSDARSRIGVPGTREVWSPDPAPANELQDLDEVRAGASLCAELYLQLVVLARGSDDQLVFSRIVTTRLFDIDVLAGVERENCGRRVPVIWRGDRDRVDILVVEDAPKITNGFGRFRLEGRRCGRRLRENVGIDIAEIPDDRVGAVGEILRVHHASSVEAHHADNHLLVGRSLECEERSDAARRGECTDSSD